MPLWHILLLLLSYLDHISYPILEKKCKKFLVKENINVDVSQIIFKEYDLPRSYTQKIVNELNTEKKRSLYNNVVIILYYLYKYMLVIN
ncbi:MAG: hypothetical protein AB8U61_00075 [Rickettsiales endosymbiont of Dermacentor nuttalli]